MKKSNQLYILWTNADVLTAEKMVLLYATNSMLRNWWGGVTVIVWGATAKLTAENELIQGKIKAAQEAGVRFSACKACSDQLGVTEALNALGVETIFWGAGLTDIIKNGEKLITV